MSKQLIQNYTFSASGRTITLTDFGTVKLERLALITDTTTNKILYNFADSSVTSATVSGNVITLAALQGGESNSDKLRIDYEDLAADPTYDVSLPIASDAVANRLLVEQRFYSYTKTTSGTQNFTVGSGEIHNLNVLGGTMGSITIYDSTGSSTNVLLPTFTPAGPLSIPLNIGYSNGCTIVLGANTIVQLGIR